MKKLIYSQEDLDLILSLEIQEKEEQITQLTNNWNDLEEFLESNWKDTQDIWYVKIINRMKEIKEKNK